jgi:hypothetical protein
MYYTLEHANWSKCHRFICSHVIDHYDQTCFHRGWNQNRDHMGDKADISTRQKYIHTICSRRDVAVILLTLVLNTNESINQYNHISFISNKSKIKIAFYYSVLLSLCKQTYSLNSMIIFMTCENSYRCFPVVSTIWSRKPIIKVMKIEINNVFFES